MNKLELENLINKNCSIRDISKELKTSATNVRYWLNKYQLKTNVKNKSILDYEELSTSICSSCNLEKSIENFYKIAGKGNLKKPCSYCIECSRNKLQNKKYNEFKSLAVNYKGGKCINCGYNRCIKALEFHHLDPRAKEFNISTILSWRKYTNRSEDELKKELDKCVLLCANCHREAHDNYENNLA